MDYSEYNPIRSVDGVSVKCPSSYKWKQQDLSDDSAGRNSAWEMTKSRCAKLYKVELKWKNVSLEDGADILTAFDPEYVTVNYLDAKAGTWKTDVFYVGDRDATLYNGELGVWSEISFNITLKNGDDIRDTGVS